MTSFVLDASVAANWFLPACSRASADSAIASMMERKCPTTPSLELLPEAFAIATTFNRTVYDALYVALAVRSRLDFITVDERLANALAAHLPVKWLGAVWA